MADNSYYIDVSKIGRDFVGKHDIAVLINEQAVLESIHNLLATQPGDRVMNPLFGTNLDQYLFEEIDSITELQIRKEIEYSIDKFEPRVENVSVIVVGNELLNSYEVTVTFIVKVLKTQQQLTFQLKKVR